MSKKVGAIIKLKREAKKLSREELAHRAKVTANHLISLEDGVFEKLPADVYVKSIINKIAKYIDIDEDLAYKNYLIQSKSHKKEKPKELFPKGLSINKVFYFSPKLIGTIAIIILVLGVGGYFFWQASKLFTAPSLEVDEPFDNITVNESPIVVKGKASDNAKVFINDQNVEVDSDGSFFKEVSLDNGLNVINIKASNRLDKKVEEILNVVYEHDGEVEGQKDDSASSNPFEGLDLEAVLNLDIKVLSSIASIKYVVDSEEVVEKVLLRDSVEKINANHIIELTVSKGDKLELMYNDQFLGEFPVKSNPSELTITFKRPEEPQEEKEDDEKEEEESQNVEPVTEADS